jgi:hypothetical protein
MAGQSRELPGAAVAALLNGNQFEAIKIARQEWGIGLKESKDSVDTYLKGRIDLASRLQQASAGNKKWPWMFVLLTTTVLVSISSPSPMATVEF